MSFGGSARYRCNHYGPNRFGLAATCDEPGGILSVLLHANVHLGDPGRIFFELGHHMASKGDFPPGPNDIDFFDVSQAFSSI
ncbi:MAG: hypothetical protein SGJ17_13450 [Hyphomicrobiales bacterium]|nr:hypothetical protein [Hyphomicrobiales bacterium]